MKATLAPLDSSPPQSADLDASDAVYLFCLARAEALSTIDGAGLEDHRPLGLITVRDVVAVISTDPVADFCGEAAEARMQDLRWIGPRACRHAAVVELAMRSSPVVPARFATLFSARASLITWLQTHYDTIVRSLDRFADHQEWAVKGTLDRRQAEAPLIAAALTRSALSASPGARYLEERRIRAGIGHELNAWLKELCERIARELREHAVEFRERAVGPKLSDDDGTPMLNWALLISSERVGEFGACIERMNAALAEQGVTIDCSGPWPPYSFCPAFDADAPAEGQGS